MNSYQDFLEGVQEYILPELSADENLERLLDLGVISYEEDISLGEIEALRQANEDQEGDDMESVFSPYSGIGQGA